MCIYSAYIHASTKDTQVVSFSQENNITIMIVVISSKSSSFSISLSPASSQIRYTQDKYQS